MTEACGEIRPRLDGLVDGESEDAALEAHLAGCAPCRAELEARAALKRALARIALPPPPRAFDRALLTPERRTWWPAAAAAGALVAVLFFSAPASVPAVVSHTKRFHEDVLSGRVTLGDLGLRPTASRAEYPTGCPCPPDLGPSSPFVVYGRGDRAVSCLALEATSPGSQTWRRLGPHTVLLRPRRGLLEVWISRLDRAGLEAWLAAHDATEKPADGKISLREFT